MVLRAYWISTLLLLAATPLVAAAPPRASNKIQLRPLRGEATSFVSRTRTICLDCRGGAQVTTSKNGQDSQATKDRLLIIYQWSDLVGAAAQIWLTWKYLSGSTQIIWACHSVVHTILMLYTEYGVPRSHVRLSPWPVIPVKVMIYYDVAFFVLVNIHNLVVREGYPWWS